ncbi:coilin isoform X2 [Panthera uncia]|uniref:coilin isoform X2 n=1 Tax=Panthera leo TaxID=9689 RepID=UPI000904C8FA|nr:coilin isoform X2 [Panthera leo]XP_049492436.1 coilin isoform X2 [Panthera uncia]
MAASETVRLRLQFDYPPPATPHCTAFWLLVDLNRCRVVTDLISLIRQRFGFSSGAILGLYLEGGLLPPAESARLVRDNDCLRVKLEERETAENTVTVKNGDDSHLLPRKAKKRAFKLEEGEETELDYRNSKKHWKRQENSSNGKTLDLEPKAATDQSMRKKGKRKNKAMCGVVDGDDEETKRKSPKRKEKCELKRQTKNSRSSKAQTVKDWAISNCGPLKGSLARNSLVKAKRKGGAGVCPKDSPISSSESESSHESTSDGVSNVLLEVRNCSEKTATELSKEGPSTKNTTANKVAAKTGFTCAAVKCKTTRASSSSSDSSSESDDQCTVSKSAPERAAGFLKPVGLFAGRGCPGPGPCAQTPHAAGWKLSDANGARQAPPGPPPNVTLPTSLGRGWGRGEDLLSWKGARGRGVRGRGRGRGQAVSFVLNRNPEYQKHQQLNEMVTNSSTIIQNPVETHKDYSLLPLLAAAPQVGEKIAFKLLELTSDYSPDVSDYKEGKILSHNPDTQQVDIEILSSLPDHCFLERVD